MKALRNLTPTIRTVNSAPKGRRGFTLVELMVSIVIVTILASMIFLFAKRGIQAAKAAKCISNMRQIHSGVTDLSQSGLRTGHNPPGTYMPYAGHLEKPWSHFVWIDLIAEQMGLAERNNKGLYEWNTHPKETIFQNPLSEFSLGGEGAEWKIIAKNRDVAGGSYCYNWRVTEWIAPHITEQRTITRMSQMKYPASTILFGENDDERARANEPSWGFWNGKPPQGNYKNGAHCAFADGHIELIPNKKLKDKKWFDHYTHIAPPKKDLSPQ